MGIKEIDLKISIITAIISIMIGIFIGFLIINHVESNIQIISANEFMELTPLEIKSKLSGDRIYITDVKVNDIDYSLDFANTNIGYIHFLNNTQTNRVRPGDIISIYCTIEVSTNNEQLANIKRVSVQIIQDPVYIVYSNMD